VYQNLKIIKHVHSDNPHFMEFRDKREITFTLGTQ